MFLLRHGQSEFNVIYGKTRRDPGIRDPILTADGREQAAAVIDVLRPLNADRIVTSPYRRTLETATILSKALGLAVEATPLISERAVFQCDVGSPVSDLRRDFPDVDFAAVTEEVWWHPGDENLDALDARCQTFRAQCRDGIYANAYVVTHWGFIRGLTNIRAQNCGVVQFDAATGHPGGGAVVYNCDTC
jgi:broad specificity phosphatase PhoE